MISSRPGWPPAIHAAPSRGARFNQPVGQSGVPRGSTFSVLGGATSPDTVNASAPCLPAGGGFTSQRTPSERLKVFESFQSSWKNAENSFKIGLAGLLCLMTMYDARLLIKD